MKKDSSCILFERYFSLSDRNIEIILKNGRILHGIFAGFFFLNDDPDNPSIHTWHFVNNNEHGNSGYCGVQFCRGELILHRDIASVTFMADHSTMVFS